MRNVTFSVLDTGRPEETVKLAHHIEAIGYDRIWVTEHHTDIQSACPSIMAAAVLTSTKRLSVTVGGVLARIHSPFVIAEQLKLLAKLFGSRIQFGVAGTLPDSHILDGIGESFAVSPEEYRQRLLQLRDFALSTPSFESSDNDVANSRQRSKDLAQPNATPTVGPSGSEPASFCVCGTSEGSATFTAELEFPFAFHDFLSPQERKEDRLAVCRKYRAAGGDKLSVAVSGLCAASTSEAEQLWEEINQGRHTRRPSFLGTVEAAAAQVATIARETTADEIVVQPLSLDLETRVATLDDLYKPLRVQLAQQKR
jgi:alkanesulfonate monooxygenase SsuD/methylene tetrahydromethanopterin reductase-like flavin-dependent oxidoreductase (luciferase family)